MKFQKTKLPEKYSWDKNLNYVRKKI